MEVERRATPYGPFAVDYLERRLIDLCLPEGGVQTGPFGSQLHKRDYVEIGTPIITVEHLGDNRILHEATPKVSDADRNRLSRYQLRPGDIVFSRVGSVDRRALVSEEEAGWLFSGRCLRVRPNPELIDPTYLSYFFGLETFKEYVRSIAVGATMPSINTAILSNVPVVFPPSIHEHQAIASILKALDDKIELNRRMSETLDRMAEAIFCEWFGSNSLVQEDTAQQPTRLRDVLTLAYGKGLRKVDRVAGPVPVFGSGGVFDYHNEALIDGPAIIVGRKGTVGSIYWVDEPSFPGDTVFYVESEQPLTYCFYLLRTLGLNAMNTDAAVPGLNRENAYRLEVPSPPTSLIERFDSATAPMRERIRVANDESQTLAELRDSLLPKLISGELRVPETEQLVSEAI